MKKISFSEACPDLVKQWHPTMNGRLRPDDFLPFSNKLAWWKCPVSEDHVWQARFADRTRGYGCGYCQGLRVCLSNCLATTHPELASAWHPTKNGDLTPQDVVAGSNRRVWWMCSVAQDHEWLASIHTRTHYGHGCPCCSGRKAVASNCLATTHPQLALQWHPTKNGDLTPFDVYAGSHKVVWWLCPIAADHEWATAIRIRADRDHGCLCCCGKKVVRSNCLAATHPELAAQWHHARNGSLTPYDIGHGMHKNVWWVCDNGHEYRSLIFNRASHNQACPYCSESKGEKLIAAILDNLGSCYEREKKIEGCRSVRQLRFDFCVEQPDGIAFIEFHGKQHYHPVKFTNTMTDEEAVANLRDTQRRDRAKEVFCARHGIPYLAIPYWDGSRVAYLLEEILGIKAKGEAA